MNCDQKLNRKYLLAVAAILIILFFIVPRSIVASIYKLKDVVEFVANIVTIVTFVGIFVAYKHLKLTRDLAVANFENQLFMEYRRTIEKFPSSIMMGCEVNEDLMEELQDKFYSYVDLTNEQIYLRMSGKITHSTWIVWRDGIKYNLMLPAFKKSWDKVKKSTSSFQELRRFENEGFMSDPISWNKL